METEKKFNIKLDKARHNIKGKYLKFLLILLSWFFLMNSTIPAHGQKQVTNTNFWFNAGLGFSLAGAGSETDFGGGLSGRLGFAFQMNQIVLSVRSSVNTGGKSRYTTYFFHNFLRDEFYETSFLIGYNLVNENALRIIPSIGIGRVRGSRVIYSPARWFDNPGSFESFDPVIGIPLELAFVGGSRFAGFGIYLYANINSEESFGGITLNLILGKLSIN